MTSYPRERIVLLLLICAGVLFVTIRLSSRLGEDNRLIESYESAIRGRVCSRDPGDAAASLLKEIRAAVAEDTERMFNHTYCDPEARKNWDARIEAFLRVYTGLPDKTRAIVLHDMTDEWDQQEAKALPSSLDLVRMINAPDAQGRLKDAVERRRLWRMDYTTFRSNFERWEFDNERKVGY